LRRPRPLSSFLTEARSSDGQRKREGYDRSHNQPKYCGRTPMRRPKPLPQKLAEAIFFGMHWGRRGSDRGRTTAKPQPDRCPTVSMSLAATGVAARGETDTVKRRPRPSMHHMVRRHFSDVKAEADVQALTEVGARTTTRSSTGTTGVVAMPDTADQIPSIRHLPTPH